jgi:hypothetical protein
MSSADAKKAGTLLPSQDRYLPTLLIIEEGRFAFHERIHYWQHVGTTFGAFQLLGFLITAKAMRTAIRSLIAAKIMEVPIQEATLEKLREKTKKIEIENVRSYLKLLNHFEPSIPLTLLPLKDPDCGTRFFGGWHDTQPLMKLSDSLGAPFTTGLVKEIHASAVETLRGGTKGALGPTETILWKRAHTFLGDQTANHLALLCDWALMSPNPNLINQQRGEINPGSRFLMGLEELAKTDTRKRKTLLDPRALANWLSAALSWTDFDTAMKHYESFIRLALQGEQNMEDARRNRRAYGAFARMLEKARDIRLTHPDAFALPHLYEASLEKALPPIAVKRGNKLEMASLDNRRDQEDKDWYVPYLISASLALQAFGYKEKRRNKIECVYHHLEIEEDCPHLKNAKQRETCYTYPGLAEETNIQCGFLTLCRKLFLC